MDKAVGVEVKTGYRGPELVDWYGGMRNLPRSLSCKADTWPGSSMVERCPEEAGVIGSSPV